MRAKNDTVGGSSRESAVKLPSMVVAGHRGDHVNTAVLVQLSVVVAIWSIAKGALSIQVLSPKVWGIQALRQCPSEVWIGHQQPRT